MVVEGKSGGKSDKMEIVKVTGAIITSKNQFLICRRGPNEKAAGFWEFPVGKIEKNETEKECIKRELKEELNINAVVGNLYDQYLYKSTNVAYDLSFFIIKKYKGNMVKTVHDNLKWVNLVDLDNYTFLPSDEPLIQKIKNDEKFYYL